MKIKMLKDADYRFSGKSTGYRVRAYKADRQYVVPREVGEDLIARKSAEPVETAKSKET